MQSPRLGRERPPLLTTKRPTLGSSSQITSSPAVTAVTPWLLTGSQGLKNHIPKASAIFKGSELQGCSFINQVQLLVTSSQSEFPGKKKKAFCLELMFEGLLYSSKSISLNALQKSNGREKLCKLAMHIKSLILQQSKAK